MPLPPDYVTLMGDRFLRHRLEDADHNRDLELPDGRPVSKVRRIELYEVLQKLGIPGTAASMTKDELLDCYRAKLESVRDELKPSWDKPDGPLSQENMREAAAFIERNAGR